VLAKNHDDEFKSIKVLYTILLSLFSRHDIYEHCLIRYLVQYKNLNMLLSNILKLKLTITEQLVFNYYNIKFNTFNHSQQQLRSVRYTATF